jgi:RimJ/RimL family protein N-acetyltransferase
MRVEPTTLEGRVIRLEPLKLEHAAALQRAADPALFAYAYGPTDWSAAGFRAYVQKALQRPDSCHFVQVLRESGQVVGLTAYLDIHPEHRGLEIGFTWIAREQQGTMVNPESKYLLLRHAFEVLGAVRVQLKTDGRNLHSQRAIEKLGARQEGYLRKHMILPDGYIRDSVMYSIIDDEWPEVKARLEQRLGYVP